MIIYLNSSLNCERSADTETATTFVHGDLSCVISELKLIGERQPNKFGAEFIVDDGEDMTLNDFNQFKEVLSNINTDTDLMFNIAYSYAIQQLETETTGTLYEPKADL